MSHTVYFVAAMAALTHKACSFEVRVTSEAGELFLCRKSHANTFCPEGCNTHRMPNIVKYTPRKVYHKNRQILSAHCFFSIMLHL